MNIIHPLTTLLLNPAVPDEKSLKTLERGWHNELIDFAQHELPTLLFILIGAFILLRVVDFFVHRLRRLADRHALNNASRASQLRTVASIIRATSFAVIGFIVLLHILSVFNINLTPLLASAGVVGVGIGLGAQSLFKDVLNGIFILVENQYNVGENVKIASLSGTVEDLTLRCTTLRDGDGTLYIIPNSQVATVANLSRDFSVGTLNISVDASADPDKVLRVLRSVATGLCGEPTFKAVIISGPDIPGIDKITGREVTYPVNIRVRVNQKDGVLRELRRRVIQAFEQESIPLGIDPANLFVAKAADPTAPPKPPTIGA
ncbi:mechanosensitive ion channel family protein [Granulicella arctica]|uniref:mechanosensitive ion channel family protein n=1 Tax=Granulicella arctica TaxID=940613 RepID=UPI00295A9550|nr:mechanosensitive ion channel family protein [Granulicella arctica]